MNLEGRCPSNRAEIVEDLKRIDGGSVAFELDCFAAITLIGTIQAACHTPAFPEESRMRLEPIGRRIEACFAQFPALAGMLAEGWEPDAPTNLV